MACSLIGFADEFDVFLGTLIALFGWPDILYSDYQFATTAIDEDKVAALREECRNLNSFDEQLVSAVRCHGDIWVNRVDPGEAPSAVDAVVVSHGVKRDDGEFPFFTKTDLWKFEATMRLRGVEIKRV